ncbi:hypothetical protein FOG50_03078 [Hanseniaspora uvarum]|uniref:RNA polymerase I-specific transcription initiation factor RRN11 n=1 Tax=Hanseniaspora uvarum TaxID=29833 RepID=A0A1E5RQM5_HANUV|nr:hypothetical protein FOG50_03078 [Hanseniaspora uvarum]OEJ89194.1 hypothetical protein AWRI3580_g2122 [Hanseniaspora uvarum]
MAAFELPIVVNNKHRRRNKNILYKKYFIYKHLLAQLNNDVKPIVNDKQKKKAMRKIFNKRLLHFKEKYVLSFDRPHLSYEEWYPKQFIEEEVINKDEIGDIQDLDGNEEEQSTSSLNEENSEREREVEKVDLSYHVFNKWNSNGMVKEMKKQNRSILLDTTKTEELESFDKQYLKKSLIHFKSKDFVTEFTENHIIDNNFKLRTTSNVMQIWHVSILKKNWDRAYRCMSIILRTENVDIRQIYSLIIVTLQNYKCNDRATTGFTQKDTLLDFLKWTTFSNSPLIRINLNKIQTGRFPFNKNIKTFSTIPHTIYYFLFYNILKHYHDFMQSQQKSDITKFKIFLASIEEMMLVPPFEHDFLFNYYLGLSYMILVDFFSILLEAPGYLSKDELFRDVNLYLNKSIKIFKQLGIPTDVKDFESFNNKGNNQNLYYVNKKHLSEQLKFLKTKIFGTSIESSSSDESSSSEEQHLSSDDSFNEKFENKINNLKDDEFKTNNIFSDLDEDEMFRQESMMFENLNGTSTQQKSENDQSNHYWMD